MQGPSRIIVARNERHPFGRELVIAFEDGDDVLETRFERVLTLQAPGLSPFVRIQTINA